MDSISAFEKKNIIIYFKFISADRCNVMNVHLLWRSKHDLECVYGIGPVHRTRARARERRKINCTSERTTYCVRFRPPCCMFRSTYNVIRMPASLVYDPRVTLRSRFWLVYGSLAVALVRFTWLRSMNAASYTAVCLVTMHVDRRSVNLSSSSSSCSEHRTVGSPSYARPFADRRTRAALGSATNEASSHQRRIGSVPFTATGSSELVAVDTSQPEVIAFVDASLLLKREFLTKGFFLQWRSALVPPSVGWLYY